MELQRLILPQKDGESELYYRGGVCRDNALYLKSGESVSFDTYFNSFLYPRYVKYTKASGYSFRVELSGTALVELRVYDGAEHTVAEFRVKDKYAAIPLFPRNLPEKGIIYPVITAETDCAVTDGAFVCECTPREIDICVAICTYKREHYVTANIELLRNANLQRITRVFVVDNGNTLDSEALSDKLIQVLPNRNYGGSGGFTRGIMEALAGEYTHIILMDDDVELNPSILERGAAFVSMLKDEYEQSWLSAAMLTLSEPYNQYEMGALWDGCSTVSPCSGLDVSRRESLLECLKPFPAGITYGAWWCLYMPLRSVKEIGLPFPFFIKFDDVEYGMRKPRGTHIITMNGISVCHEKMDMKYNFHLLYYDVRNQLIANAVNDIGGSYKSAIYRLFGAVSRSVVFYRYDVVPLIMRAFNDFLEGTKFFLNCDAEKLNADVIASVPKLEELVNIPGWTEELRTENRDVKRFKPLQAFAIFGHFIPFFFLSKTPVAVPLHDGRLGDGAVHRRIISYQEASGKGMLCKRSFLRFIGCSFSMLCMVIKLLFKYRGVARDFRENKHLLTSEEYWREQLKL